MAEVQRTYPEQFNERDLFVLELEKPEDFPEQLALSSPRFACLLVWDARESDEVRVGQLARKLLSAGAVYICIWGPDCRRVHEIIGRTPVAAASCARGPRGRDQWRRKSASGRSHLGHSLRLGA